MQRLEYSKNITIRTRQVFSIQRGASLVPPLVLKRQLELFQHQRLHVMKAKNTLKESRTDWNRLKKAPDRELDFSDIPKLDQSFFDNAQVRMPRRKKALSIRLAADVIDWFKEEGKRYQQRFALHRI